jgi:hypothetical protein
MEINDIQTLLTEIKTFNLKHEKLSQQSGENFNIFKILRVESSEVRLHSRFLAELLNSYGSHGQKELFLKLFVDEFQFRNNDFDPVGAFIRVEKHTALNVEDDMQSGRIDIVITDRSGKHIIIENKIYAKDQEKQLLKYHHYSPNSDLFYLTLFGTEPSKYSCGDLVRREHFECLSYDKQISAWLEKCRSAVNFNPIVRESISQYINLLKFLTNQPINKEMTDELSTILQANLKAAFTIKNNLHTAKKALLDKLERDVLELEKELSAFGYVCKYNIDTNEEYSSFRFRKQNWQYVDIAFQLADNGKFLNYGLATIKDPEKVQIPLELRQALELRFKTKTNEAWWPVKIKPEPPYNKNWAISFEPWQAIEDGTMKNLIRKYLNEMILLIGDTEL